MAKNCKFHRGINVDHEINVDQHSALKTTKQVQIQHTVFALVSWFWVLIYINSKIYINSSERNIMIVYLNADYPSVAYVPDIQTPITQTHPCFPIE
jgi:hypothetical protein